MNKNLKRGFAVLLSAILCFSQFESLLFADELRIGETDNAALINSDVVAKKTISENKAISENNVNDDAEPEQDDLYIAPETDSISADDVSENCTGESSSEKSVMEPAGSTIVDAEMTTFEKLYNSPVGYGLAVMLTVPWEGTYDSDSFKKPESAVVSFDDGEEFLQKVEYCEMNPSYGNGYISKLEMKLNLGLVKNDDLISGNHRLTVTIDMDNSNGEVVKYRANKDIILDSNYAEEGDTINISTHAFETMDYGRRFFSTKKGSKSLDMSPIIFNTFGNYFPENAQGYYDTKVYLIKHGGSEPDVSVDMRFDKSGKTYDERYKKDAKYFEFAKTWGDNLLIPNTKYECRGYRKTVYANKTALRLDKELEEGWYDVAIDLPDGKKAVLQKMFYGTKKPVVWGIYPVGDVDRNNRVFPFANNRGEYISVYVYGLNIEKSTVPKFYSYQKKGDDVKVGTEPITSYNDGEGECSFEDDTDTENGIFGAHFTLKKENKSASYWDLSALDVSDTFSINKRINYALRFDGEVAVDPRWDADIISENIIYDHSHSDDSFSFADKKYKIYSEYYRMPYYVEYNKLTRSMDGYIRVYLTDEWLDDASEVGIAFKKRNYDYYIDPDNYNDLSKMDLYKSAEIQKGENGTYIEYKADEEIYNKISENAGDYWGFIDCMTVYKKKTDGTTIFAHSLDESCGNSYASAVKQTSYFSYVPKKNDEATKWVIRSVVGVGKEIFNGEYSGNIGSLSENQLKKCAEIGQVRVFEYNDDGVLLGVDKYLIGPGGLTEPEPEIDPDVPPDNNALFNKVTFLDEDGNFVHSSLIPDKESIKATLTSFEIETLEEAVSKEGDLLGWYSGNTKWNYTFPVTSDLTLTAKVLKSSTVSDGNITKRSGLDVRPQILGKTVYMVKGQSYVFGGKGWKTNNKDCVSVSEKNGAVKARKAGTAKIQSDDKEYEVIVISPTVSKKKLTIAVGQTDTTLKLSINKEYAQYYPVTWISNNPRIAEVDDGKIYGVASGTVHVKAFVGGIAYSCKVTVKDTVANNKDLERDSKLNLIPFQSVNLKYDKKVFDVQNATWITSGGVPFYKINKSATGNGIVSITGKGKLTAQNVGDTTIIGTDRKGRSVRISVVVASVSNVVYVNTGKKANLKYYKIKSDSRNASWSTTDGSIATVKKGVVKAGNTRGSALITCSYKSGNSNVSYKTRVYVEKPQLLLDEHLRAGKKSGLYTIEIKKGEEYRIKDLGIDQQHIWTSGNKGVACVDENGIVYAIKHGNTNLTMKVNGQMFVVKLKVSH